jgi:hypothetical protein
MGAQRANTPPHQQTYLLARIDLKSHQFNNMAATHMQFVPLFCLLLQNTLRLLAITLEAI